MKIKKNELLFYLAYTLLFISFFLGDVNIDIGLMGSVFRYFAYLILIIQLFMSNWKLKDILSTLVLMMFSIVFYFVTKDLYWAVLVLIIFETKNIEVNNIFKYTSVLVIVGILGVVVACLIGILPDVLTSREGMGFVGTRHSFGFVHSNVFPLLVVYILLYYIWIKKEKVKWSILLLFTSIELILFRLCDARNSFYATILILVLMVVFKLFNHKRLINIFEKLCYAILPVLSMFSYAMTFLLLKGGIYDKIDSFFSGRFRIAIYKANLLGIHFVNFMSDADYFKDGMIIDNGYLYIILRYGLAFIIIYYIVNCLLVKKVKKNRYLLSCIFVVWILNFIDNDLVDYSVLPFIIFALNGNILDENKHVGVESSNEECNSGYINI